ncbi:MAG: hypothetical protein R3D45_13795 [Rhizobiaceae bacterium]
MNDTHPVMARLKVLAIAVATGRLGYVFLQGGELMEWKMSRRANRSEEAARSYVKRLIERLEPNVVATEKVGKHSRKGDHTKRIIAAVARVAEQSLLLDVVVPRLQQFANKYAEAEALAERFPSLKRQVPRQPRIWESESYSTIYFEAMALALAVIDQPQPT